MAGGGRRPHLPEGGRDAHSTRSGRPPWRPSDREEPFSPRDSETDRARRSSLRLAEAALRWQIADDAGASRPPQVGVLGPTQTGKSTIVNLLVGASVSEVSPLAGFTVHPLGVYVGGRDGDEPWTKPLFPGWPRRRPEELIRDELDAYALLPAKMPAAQDRADDLFSQSAGALPSCVIWDTPDFDSLSASAYERGVLEVAALSDVYVIVLSKEKYSDLTVWHVLELLEPLGRPLVICLNKLSPPGEDKVLASLRQRLEQRVPAWGGVEIVTLPVDPTLAEGKPAAAAEYAGRLRKALSSAADRAAAGDRAPGVRRCVRKNWQNWLKPLHDEQNAIVQWDERVDAAVEQFLAAYKRDYLEHPQRYDAFRRASVTLLELLELPVVGGIVTRTRQVVTWPVRRLLAAGRTWTTRRQAPPRDSVHSLSAEASVLLDAVETMLAALRRDVARRCTQGGQAGAVWQALDARLESQAEHLRETFEAGIRAHHEATSREIRAAAHALYDQLQKRPARLTALRGARATIDVGSIVLAVKSGGLAPIDALWAPATLAFTSLLVEGFAGLEMTRLSRSLKAKQWETVRHTLVQDVLVRELRGLGERLEGPGLLGIGTDEVDAAARALAQWESRHE